MPKDNKKQKHYWTENAGKGWIQDKEILDKRLNKFGQIAIEKLDIRKGMKVLDIGCGTGITSMQISKILGKNGIVDGLDFSETMISWAKKNYKKSNNIFFDVVDIQSGVLKKNFYDKVFSRMGVMFFSDPIEAFRNIYSCIKFGGKLSFACFLEPKRNEWYSITTNINKNIITSSNQVGLGDKINVQVSDGNFYAKVLDEKEKND